MNLAKFDAVLAQIKAHPETWNQGAWHCGSAHCFAGWLQVMGGYEESWDYAPADARSELGITAVEAEWLFDACRTIEDFERFRLSKAPNVHAPMWFDGVDADGFGLDGFNRDGYDRNGFDSQGFNVFGYDHEGLDKEGFNQHNVRIKRRLED